MPLNLKLPFTTVLEFHLRYSPDILEIYISLWRIWKSTIEFDDFSIKSRPYL